MSDKDKMSVPKTLEEMTLKEVADFDAHLGRKLLEDQDNLSAWIARYGTCRRMLEIMMAHCDKMASEAIARHTEIASAEKEGQTKH